MEKKKTGQSTVQMQKMGDSGGGWLRNKRGDECCWLQPVLGADVLGAEGLRPTRKPVKPRDVSKLSKFAIQGI